MGSGSGLSRDEWQALFLLTARAWGIPEPEERVAEAAAELEELVGHIATVMEYPLPPDTEPAPGLRVDALVPLTDPGEGHGGEECGGKGGGARGGQAGA